MLTAVAIQFLIMHEYAHLIFGHVHKLNNEKGAFILSEVDANSSSSGFDGLTLQTWEMDADCYAAKMSILRLLQMVRYKDQLNPQIRDFYNSDEAALTTLSFAWGCLFNLFGLGPVRWHDLDTYTHPPAIVRNHYCMAAVHTFLQTAREPSLEILTHSISSGLGLSFQAFNEIFEDGMDPQSHIKMYTEGIGMAHAKKLYKNWQYVRPSLEPFSRGRLAKINPEW